MLSALLAFLGRIAAWFRPVITDTMVEVMKVNVNTPEYSATTVAESVATPEQQAEVIEQIQNSELWKATHSKP
jgi:hypothetical protein